MPDDLIELVAPGGCDEANHDLVRYRVDNSGRVKVPREAAFWLIKSAGFRPAPADETPTETTAPKEDGDGADPVTDPRRVPRRSNRT